MATVRQKKLAKAIVETMQSDTPLNKQELVASVGYSKMSADKKATEIIESKGTQEALADLGFSEDGAKQVVQEIMYNPKVDASARLKATDQVFKVQGSYAPEKHTSVNLHLTNTDNEKELKELAIKVREQMRRDYAEGDNI